MSNQALTHQHVLEDGSMIQHTHMQEHTPAKAHKNEQSHTHKRAHPNSTKAPLYNEDEHEHTHAHLHAHHGHTHTHQNTKAVLNRLSKVIGHLEAVKRMVESGRDCSEVLVQLAAVKSAINSTGKVILKEHIEHCIVDAVKEQDMAALEELNKAIDRFMK